jgi:hypothetical protein
VIGERTDPVLAAAAEFRNARRALHRRELERLGDALAMPQLRLPHVVTAGLDARRRPPLAAGPGPARPRLVSAHEVP